MKICPKCKSIMLPKKEGGSAVFKCHCGYSEKGEAKIREAIKQEKKEIGVVEKEIETLPVVKATCPHCKNEEAFNWEIQTRSPDEAATQFFRCKKCNHTWREYR
jgi:DNA-directed RNA polymerase subunit M